MREPRLHALLLCVACVGLAHAALAQQEPESPLSVAFRPVVPARTGAPIWVDVEFDSRLPGLLQGRLEAAITDESRGSATYCSDDMVVAAGRQTFRMMLPPFSGSVWSTQHAIRAAFHTEGGTYAFKPQPLSLPQRTVRDLVVCVAASDIEMRLVADDVASSLRLERYDPESVPANARTYVTHVDRLEPADLPASPLTCCCFDILVLPPDGFAALQARQLDALRRWVEGGGSLCVLPRAGLKDRHEQFLNALSAGAAKPFHLGPAGDVGTDATAEDIAMLRPGVGRVVVVLPDAQDHLDTTSARWRRAVAHLWKFRAEQTARMVTGQRWEAVPEDSNAQYRRARSTYETPEHQDFSHIPFYSAGFLHQCLMPEGVRMVPAGILLLVFLAFVAAIGPVDYWLLGRLKKRALTWLLFPALSLGCAGLVVYLSEHHMGSQNHAGALVFVDVDRSGRAVRYCRCEMLFGGRSHTVERRIQNALFGTEEEGSGDYGGHDVVPAYAGRYPFDFTVSRRIKQWAPAFSRLTSFEPPTLPTHLNWGAVEKVDLGTHRGRARAFGALCGDTQFNGQVFVLHGEGITAIGGRTDGLWPPGRKGEFSGFPPFLQQVCARPREGLFGVVSQVSPGDTATLEDLSVFDPSDPKQTLLIAVERVGTDFYVYRCLFCGED